MIPFLSIEHYLVWVVSNPCTEPRSNPFHQTPVVSFSHEVSYLAVSSTMKYSASYKGGWGPVLSTLFRFTVLNLKSIWLLKNFIRLKPICVEMCAFTKPARCWNEKASKVQPLEECASCRSKVYLIACKTY